MLTYAVDDRSLMAFATTAEAIAEAEYIDVKDGNWLFFDERGKSLSPEFPSQSPLQRFIGGPIKYTLVPTKEGLLSDLRDLLPQVSLVEGMLTSIDEVRKVLTIGSSDRGAASSPNQVGGR
jgi:hypothetical protein